MISRVTGEVSFHDGLSFAPHGLLTEEHLRDACGHTPLPVPGWTHHQLGEHESEHGRFAVEAVTDRACRVMAVFLAHQHAFYEAGTAGDAERHTYHEGVLA